MSHAEYRIAVYRSFGENQSGHVSCMLKNTREVAGNRGRSMMSCGGRPPTFFNLTSPGWVESPRCGAVVWRAVVGRKADDRKQSMSLALNVAIKAQTVCEQSPLGCPARRTMPKQAPWTDVMRIIIMIAIITSVIMKPKHASPAVIAAIRPRCNWKGYNHADKVAHAADRLPGPQADSFFSTCAMET